MHNIPLSPGKFACSSSFNFSNDAWHIILFLAAIAFHFIINLSQEAFEITQITKCIETFVLLLFATLIVLLNKDIFFDKVSGRNHE